MKNIACIYILLALVCLQQSLTFAVVSGLTAGLAGIASFAITSYDTVRCCFAVCCNDEWIPNNLISLTNDLSQKLHGQHLVQKTVVGHIKGHLRSRNPAKALVLSFHGPTGVGKNFVSQIIADSLYKRGIRNTFVHLISATKEFPHEGMIPFYKDQLKQWIEGNVSMCERSMFIFDEVDKLPALLLDVIKPYLDHYPDLNGVDYRKAIFLFLSNSAATEIAQTMLAHWEAGKGREELLFSDVENKVTLAAMNPENRQGLWHSQLISKHLITAFIPFLPLEKNHVRKCVKDALINQRYFGPSDNIPRDIIDNVLQQLVFTPAVEQLFSITGCKRVTEKVDFVMMDVSPDELKRMRKLEL